MPGEISLSDLVQSLKKAVGALREADVPFMLGGGLACLARGGPETDHDVDLFLKPEDAERALDEMALDFKGPLQIARALREQIDWDAVRERTESSPYAKGFLTVVEELGITDSRVPGASLASAARGDSANSTAPRVERSQRR